MATTTAAKIGIEIGAAFAGNFKSVFGSANSEVGKIGGAIKKLEGRQRELNAVIAQQQRLGANGSALKALYSQQEIDQITAKITKLKNAQAALTRFSGAGVGKAMDDVGAKFRSLATQATVAGVGLGYFFKTQFVDVASEFERFKTILETTEGSSKGADKAMQWVSDFATKTPFELAEVTEAFVKLRAYGLDPTNGLLKTLGDTGAAMGKPVMQAVEAIADAVTGENERLKEFGIKGSKKGGKVTYEYTDKAGKQQTKTVDANNRKMIESTLSAIWNEKYSGAMDKLAGTWVGMVSNLKDQWARFTNTAMNAGLFDWMKGKLSSLLDTLNTMAANGELQKWAETTGTKLKEFAEGAWALGSAIADTTKKIANFVGGWENLGIILVAIKFAPLLLSVGQLGMALGTATTSLLMFATGTASAGAAWTAFGGTMVTALGMIGTAFKTLAAFMLTNPIGIAITLLATAGYLLWKNWDDVKGGLLLIWQAISDAGVTAFNWLRERIGEVMDWIGGKIDWIFNKLTTAKQMYVDLFSGDFGKAFDSAKSFYGFGGTEKAAGSAPAGAQPAAPAAAMSVPAARTAPVVQQTNQTTNTITVQGAQDPAATARAITFEMDRRERQKAANRRGSMVDPLGM